MASVSILEHLEPKIVFLGEGAASAKHKAKVQLFNMLQT